MMIRPPACIRCQVLLVGLAVAVVLPTAPAGAETCANAQFRAGASAALPDCRAFEQISPVEKDGYDGVSLQPVAPVQSGVCEAGEECTVAYMTVDGAFAGAPGNDLYNAYLGSRGDSRWDTTALTPPTTQVPADGIPLVSYAFSEDLEQTVLRVPFQALTEGAQPDIYNLFLRRADGSYSLITAATPAEVPPANCGNCFQTEDVSVFAGASSDFSRVIFEANDSLVAGAPGGGVQNLYESFDGRVRLVGYLPDGSIPPDGATAGAGMDVLERARDLRHAISADGSRVLFEAASDGGITRPGGPEDPAQSGKTELFDRVNGASTVEVSAPAPGAEASDCETPERNCEAQPAQFWGASADGSAVFFTSKAALTKDSYVGTEGSNLYRYDADSGTLSNLAAADGEAGAAGATVLGVVGISDDGSYVYFVAKGVLAGAARDGHSPQSGEPNLYVWHQSGEGGAATLAFIATLKAPDTTIEALEEGELDEEERLEEEDRGPHSPYRSDISDWTSRPIMSQAYVTPDGRHLAFMSAQPLTGYDNELPTREGEKPMFAHEVFEYSAETGELSCASCDPGGQAPLGSAFIGAELGERASTPFYQPRALSDDGRRLFFASPDVLAPGVQGGVDKVFEYEDGSVHLLSGPEPGTADVFLDASPSGNDAFIATRERLVPSDTDELLDVYDARVDGGVASPPSPPSSSCPGECPPLAPEPSVLTPTSAVFTGSGNVEPSPKPLSRQQLLARALAKCRKLASRARRAACVRSARRRYAPAARHVRRGRTSKHRAGRR
jgi:hypothetical protein